MTSRSAERSTAARLGPLLLVAIGFGAAWLVVHRGASGDGADASTELLREQGVALWFEGRFEEAKEIQRSILERSDALALDHANLACTYLRQAVGAELVDEPKIPGWVQGAKQYAEQALAKDGTDAGANWVEGAIAEQWGTYVKLERDDALALECYARILRQAPNDWPSLCHHAIALEASDRKDEALAEFRRIVDVGVEVAGVQVYRAALHHYYFLLLRSHREGDHERGLGFMDLFEQFREQTRQRVQENIDEWVGVFGLPRGARQWVPSSRVELPSAVSFDPTPLRLLESAGAVRSYDVGDFDQDGRDDLVVAGERGLFVALAQKDGSFRESRVSDATGELVLAVDLENEGGEHYGLSDSSVLLVADGRLRLFSPRSQPDQPLAWLEDTAKLPPLPRVLDVTPVDFDHDGNLDLVLVTSDGLRFVRNDGVPRSEEGNRDTDHRGLPEQVGFTDVTGFGLLTGTRGDWVAIEDFDGDQDVDLLVGGKDVPTTLLLNLRCMRFQALGPEKTGLPARIATRPLVGDVDEDGVADVVVLGAEPTLSRGKGDGTFAPATASPSLSTAAAAGEARGDLVDVDLDGVLDAVVSAGGEARWTTAAGRHGESARALPGRQLTGRACFSPCLFDLDRDLALDVVAVGEKGLEVHRGRLADPPRRMLLELRGRKDNHAAVGTTLEVRHGNRYQRRFTRRAQQLYGFAPGSTPIVRITWPDGVGQYPLQTAGLDLNKDEDLHEADGDPKLAVPADLAKDLRAVVVQKKGPPGSCPFLYSWNGERYVFVTDVLGATPLGLPIDDTHYVEPAHEELVRLTSQQLAPVDGEYRLQLTEELRETTYLDRAQLWVVDHASDVEVHPEERFCFPPFPPKRLHAMRRIEPLVRAVDQRGHDWTDELARADDTPAVPFKPFPELYRGIASTHWLELTLPESAKTAKRVRLLMTGWLMWGDASVNKAMAHNGTVHFVPPVVSAPDDSGAWHECGPPVGFPAGKTKTMVLDVTGMLNRADPRLRFTSTLELYWDQVRVACDAGANGPDDEQGDAPLTVTKLEPKVANVWHRGFSKPLARRPDQPLRFDWDRLEEQPRWNQHVGMLTRLGDVRPLLERTDDEFVLFSSGDAIDLRFDASAIAPPKPGMARTFLLRLDGWAKDADPNTTTSQTVEPLPFHSMSGYPYGRDEHYPDDETHRNYRAEWNTRPGARLIPSLVERR